MERTVLVTGGAGYIGSHACKALARAGFSPVCYDNLVHGFRELVRWGPLAEGDLLDTDRLAAVMALHRPVAVLHFAALIEAGESVADPAPFYRANLMGTLSLMQAMRRVGVEKLVVSSTAAVYGDPSRTPIPEEHPLAPVNPYGWSKLMAEQAVRDFCAAYGLSAIALRYFNAAGADPEGEIGRMGDAVTHLIPNVLRVAQGKAPALRVFGGDYPTPDRTARRDYVHVWDLALAHVAALERLLGPSGRGGEKGGVGKGAGAVYNLGTGRPWSVLEVLRAAEKVTGKPIPCEMGPRRAGDPVTVVADPSRARRDLGWEPRFSDLPTMVRTAWEWTLRQGEAAPRPGAPAPGEGSS